MKKLIKNPNTFIPFLITVTGLACFGRIIAYDFFIIDDAWLISKNSILTTASWQHLSNVLFDFSESTRFVLGAEYLPTRDLVTMLFLNIFGANAFIFLTTNLVLYIASSILLFFILQKLREDYESAGLIAMLFLLHPLHVESVAWASSLKDMLCLFFFFLAWLYFERCLEKPSFSYFLLVALFAVLSMTSKYVGITLGPLLFLRLIWLPRAEITAKTQVFLQILFGFLAVATTVHLFLIFKVGQVVNMIQDPQPQPWLLGVVNWIWLLLINIKHIFAPISLGIFYEFEPISSLVSLHAAAVVLCASLILMPFALHLFGKKKLQPSVLFWSAAFLLFYLPVSQLTPLQNKIADRYMLFCVLPWCVGIILLLKELALNMPVLSHRLHAVAIALLVLFGGFSFLQVSYWQDSETLLLHSVEVSPHSAKAHLKLSQYLFEREDFETQQTLLNIMLTRFPNNDRVWVQQGRSLYMMGAPLESVEEALKKAMAINPKNAKAHYNLGFIFLQRDKLDAAADHLRLAVQFAPDYCRAIALLRDVYQKQGRDFEARNLEQTLTTCRSTPRLPIDRFY